MTSDLSPPLAAAPPTRVRYLVVGLCVGMSLLLYLDRFALSPATDAILQELHLTKEQFGRTYFVFFFAYALMQVPAGWLSDNFGARGTLVLYVFGWSLATVCLGFANGLMAISLVRFMLGVTQAGAYPAAASLLKRWVPATGRGRANSIVAMGGRAGGLIAFFFTPLLMLLAGHWLGWQTGRWRAVFIFYGSLGFVWAAAFWWLFRDSPRRHPWCNANEADLIDSAASTLRVPSAAAATIRSHPPTAPCPSRPCSRARKSGSSASSTRCQRRLDLPRLLAPAIPDRHLRQLRHRPHRRQAGGGRHDDRPHRPGRYVRRSAGRDRDRQARSPTAFAGDAACPASAPAAWSVSSI